MYSRFPTICKVVRCKATYEIRRMWLQSGLFSIFRKSVPLILISDLPWFLYGDLSLSLSPPEIRRNQSGMKTTCKRGSFTKRAPSWANFGQKNMKNYPFFCLVRIYKCFFRGHYSMQYYIGPDLISPLESELIGYIRREGRRGRGGEGETHTAPRVDKEICSAPLSDESVSLLGHFFVVPWFISPLGSAVYWLLFCLSLLSITITGWGGNRDFPFTLSINSGQLV